MSSRYERMLEAIANGERITEEPISRREMFLKALANGEGISNLPTPICREERFYKAIIQGETITDKPMSRREEYLKALANKEPIPTCPVSCNEEALLKRVCECGIGGGGGTPAPTTYSVTFGTGVTVKKGSTSITSGTKVESGTILTISYTLSEGHHLGHFRVNSVDVENNSTITITKDTSITFLELRNTYWITFDEGVTVYDEIENRYIGNGSGLIYGARLKVSYTLSENHHLTSFQINGVDVENNTSIILKENIHITFTQEGESYEVIFDEGVSVLNGTTQLTSGDTVPHGTNLTIGYTLSDHYHLTSFQVNGTDVENNSTITVTSKVTITFTQAIDTYSVTFGAGVSVLNGGTSLTSGDVVPYGTSLVIGYTLTDGYKLTLFQVNGVDTENNATIVVTENIEITFAEEEESTGGFSSIFSENTPAQISAVGDEIASAGMTSADVEATYGWKLGDTKDITLTTGEVITVRIIGFNHDDLSDGSGKAGITLQMVECLATRYPMNSTDTNAGGYAASKMKTETLPTLKALLPQEWQDVIKLVDKKSANGGSSNYSETLTTSNDLFLLAEIEVFRATTNAKDGENEGSIYEYWNGKAAADRIKKYDKDADGVPETATYWLLRSSASSNISYFCGVYAGGTAGSANASASRGVSFAFCV